MFVATIQDSFDFGARTDTGLYLTHLIGEPVPGDRFGLAGTMRLVTRVDNRRRSRNCLTAAPLPGAPRLDIRTGQTHILLDADNECAAVILTTHVETRRADDLPQGLLRRAGHAGIDELRSQYPDLSDDAPILCHGLQLIEIIG